MANNGLILSKKIYGVYPNSFASFFVTGTRGIGKTSYSLKVLHEVFVQLGHTDNESWRLALGCLKFQIPEVISYLREAIDKDEKLVCVLWDDLRVFAGGTQYFLNMRLVEKLKGLLDTIRTATSSIIMTAPSSVGVLGVLRSYDDYQIKVGYSPRGGWFRISRGYLWSSLPSGKRLVYKKFEDHFSCYLPKWVYDKYSVIRKQALKDILIDLEKTVKND